MCCLMPMLFLTILVNRFNRFATPVRLVWCVQEVRSVRPVVITGQTGCCVTSCLFSFSCVPSHVICVMHSCLELSYLFASHKLRDIGKFHVSY
jgi:hypothetical protein